jgi:hypothetical protein
MAHGWIDEGLQHARERAEGRRVAVEQSHHRKTVIREKGPELMRGIFAEVQAVIDEFRHKAGAGHLEFQLLPREGFSLTRVTPPRVGLECRPDYEMHALYCNMTRTADLEGEIVEWPFSLEFITDDSDRVELRSGSRTFHAVDEVVEFLLKPVLFPSIDPHR